LKCYESLVEARQSIRAYIELDRTRRSITNRPIEFMKKKPATKNSLRKTMGLDDRWDAL